MIAPAFKKLAKEYEGRAVFAKVDVNRQHEVRSDEERRPERRDTKKGSDSENSTPIFLTY